MSWRCPYCNQIASDAKVSNDRHYFNEGNKVGDLALGSHIRVCPNEECKEYTILMWLQPYILYSHGKELVGKQISQWMLKPQSSAKPLPDYIPQAIQSDYYEACLIADLSPKASATLSRRCLQGMIRDFFGVSGKRTLKAEMKQSRTKLIPPHGEQLMLCAASAILAHTWNKT